jgi:hypothetical protein
MPTALSARNRTSSWASTDAPARQSSVSTSNRPSRAAQMRGVAPVYGRFVQVTFGGRSTATCKRASTHGQQYAQVQWRTEKDRVYWKQTHFVQAPMHNRCVCQADCQSACSEAIPRGCCSYKFHSFMLCYGPTPAPSHCTRR